MANPRPKLRITPPPGTDTTELMRLLGDRYDLEFVADGGSTAPASSNGPRSPTAELKVVAIDDVFDAVASLLAVESE